MSEIIPTNQKEADKLLNKAWEDWINSDFDSYTERELDVAWENNKKIFKLECEKSEVSK